MPYTIVTPHDTSRGHYPDRETAERVARRRGPGYRARETVPRVPLPPAEEPGQSGQPLRAESPATALVRLRVTPEEFAAYRRAALTTGRSV
jgi:hypothetical protein